MTRDEFRDARAALGKMWGFGRPLHYSEMAKALGLSGNDPAASARDYERGKTAISGPVSLLIGAYLRGMPPPWSGAY